MDIASGFHLIMREKRKRAVFVFSLQIRRIEKIKDVLSWQLRKKGENNLTRLNKTHRRKGKLQTESKPAHDEGEMQTYLLEPCLPACVPVCLSVSIPDYLSNCRLFTPPAFKSGISPALRLPQQLVQSSFQGEIFWIAVKKNCRC